MPRISAATIGEHRALTHERVMEAVARLSRGKGIDGMSMTDVAAEAGITRTVLYNYFPDKAAVLLAFTERVTQYFVESYARDLPSDASAAERLRAFIRLQLTGLVAHPHPGAADLSATLGPDAYQRLAAHVAPMQAVLVEILRDPSLGVTDVEATGRAILAVLGAQRLPLLDGSVTLAQSEEFVSGFVLRALS